MASISDTDPTSFSRPDEASVSHISLSLVIDFARKILSGTAVLSINIKTPGIRTVVLDSNELIIKSVYLPLGEKLNFEFGNCIPNIGKPLIIHLPITVDASSSEKLLISIDYETSPQASGLQWLSPEQTHGKRDPFLFSQCEAIHARSVYPCQDTPSVKFTYDAQVEASTQFTVLMSAVRNPVVEKKGANRLIHRFKQRVPIPSYLLAIAAGSLDFREISPRCKVWAELGVVESALWEFADTDKMLSMAEELCGPYVWGDYDLLVLPPSFPYGGMENPCLTFVTPVLLAGDRSLADVIVHEISHSWTGNLVTNATFEHFWLNEGFTVFVERKISAKLQKTHTEREARDFSSLQGLKDLSNTVNEHLGPSNPLTKLVVDLTGINPDDSFSSVPYEKGSIFLRYLEDLLGGPDAFDPFLRHYIKEFKEKSIKTSDFKQCLTNFFKDEPRLKEIDWDAWLYTAGMPHIIPVFDKKLLNACKSLADKWLEPHPNVNSDVDYQEMSPTQRIAFYQSLLDGGQIPIETLKTLQDRYRPHESQNSEIKFRWLRICVKSRWNEKVKDALQFINEQGRMKFVRPIYRDLYAWTDVRDQAIANFNTNKQSMMHVLSYNIEKDLHLHESQS